MRKKNFKFMPAKLRKKIRTSPKYWGSLVDLMRFRGFKKNALEQWAQQCKQGILPIKLVWF